RGLHRHGARGEEEFLLGLPVLRPHHRIEAVVDIPRVDVGQELSLCAGWEAACLSFRVEGLDAKLILHRLRQVFEDCWCVHSVFLPKVVSKVLSSWNLYEGIKSQNVLGEGTDEPE